MKICVLGLEGAALEAIFGDERLLNLRRLMDFGVYGRLQSVCPPSAVPGWMCMATSQDPGSLGVYGLRNRPGHSYNDLRLADSASSAAPAIWDHLAQHDKRSIIVGVPPNYPPRRINGISIGCFLTADPVRNDFVHPEELKAKIIELVGEYPVDVKDSRGDEGDRLKEEIFDMSRKQWQVVRWLLAEQEWDYFHFVDIGLGRLQHAFWNSQEVISDYYLSLDEQIGSVLELLDDETVVLVMSDHGTQHRDQEFAVNEWLIGEGLLVVSEPPKTLMSLEKQNVNWSKTKAWAEGGNCAQIFFNLQGREPQGGIPVGEYESFQNEMKSRIEELQDNKGGRLNPGVFKPKEIYRDVRNVAPDLIVDFGHAPNGTFILTAPNSPLSGEYEGAHLLDMAPTLLDLAGYQIPEAMQGRSLVAGMEKKTPGTGSSEDDKQIIHDRLAGLGYI